MEWIFYTTDNKYFRLGFERDINKEKPRRVAIKSINKNKIPLNKGAASDVMNEVNILSK